VLCKYRIQAGASGLSEHQRKPKAIGALADSFDC
jgi:hypothetical protein